MAHLADRPLPDAPDGKYAYQVAPKETSPFQGPTPAEVATRSKLTILGKKLESQIAQGLPIPPNKIDEFLVRACRLCFPSSLMIYAPRNRNQPSRLS